MGSGAGMMRRRSRMRKFPVGLDPETAAKLRRDAAAHGVSQAEYVRSLINQRRPGAKPGTVAAAADAWWDSRSPKRRISVYRNHCAANDDETDPYQLTIFEEVAHP